MPAPGTYGYSNYGADVYGTTTIIDMPTDSLSVGISLQLTSALLWGIKHQGSFLWNDAPVGATTWDRIIADSDAWSKENS